MEDPRFALGPIIAVITRCTTFGVGYLCRKLGTLTDKFNELGIQFVDTLAQRVESIAFGHRI